jgi:hypothetical protein
MTHGGGIITRVGFNAYPVRETDTFTIMLRKYENGVLSDLETLTFTGSMHSLQTHHILTTSETQIMVSHVGSTYQVGGVRIRMYIEVTSN